MKFHANTVRRGRLSNPIRASFNQRVARLILAGAVLAAPSAAYAQSACDADLDGNGEVNGADLTVVLVSWGACKGCAADIDNDGTVNGADLASLLILWGQACVQGPVIKSVSPDNAPRWGGVDVVISGSNLQNSSVMFGTTLATVRFATDTEIVVSAPPLEPGVFDLIVSKYDGSGSATADDAFTVTATLVPEWATVVAESPDPEVVTDPAVLEAIRASGLPWRVLAGASGFQGEPIPMVLVPSGSFQRGCYQVIDGTTCPPDALPALAIYMPAFYISETEIKQSHFTSRGLPNNSLFQAPSNPIENVDNYLLDSFLSTTGCRLPTEAEWEYAYRAGTTTAYFTGSNDPYNPTLPGWFSSPTQPVGQLAPNGFGLYDMAGNVAERVSDWYQPDYYLNGEFEQFNPQGPITGQSHVVRGGGWIDWDLTKASAYRRETTDSAYPFALGFRVAKSAPSNPVLTGVFPPRGLATGGGAVVVKGQNLLEVTGVYFGGPYPMGVPGTIINKQWGQIQVEVPPGYPNPSPVDIYVTLPGPMGVQVVSLPQSFQYADFSWAAIIDPLPDPGIVYDAEMRDKITKTGLPARVRHIATGMEMLLVPAGTYNMGCSASQDFACSADELPVHPVTITEPFYLARYEWKNNEDPNGLFPYMTTPVVHYNWNEFKTALESYGLRFPTEAEWEYAYRAGTTTAYHSALPDYPDGSNDEIVKWFIGCLGTNPEGNPGCEAGQRLPNGLGFHDMTGNAREFVADWYGPYQSGPQTDPTGPAMGTQRVSRGGSWIEWYGRGRASAREPWSPSLYSGNPLNIGVRPARSWR